MRCKIRRDLMDGRLGLAGLVAAATTSEPICMRVWETEMKVENGREARGKGRERERSDET